MVLDAFASDDQSLMHDIVVKAIRVLEWVIGGEHDPAALSSIEEQRKVASLLDSSSSNVQALGVSADAIRAAVAKLPPRRWQGNLGSGLIAARCRCDCAVFYDRPWPLRGSPLPISVNIKSHLSSQHLLNNLTGFKSELCAVNNVI